MRWRTAHNHRRQRANRALRLRVFPASHWSRGPRYRSRLADLVRQYRNGAPEIAKLWTKESVSFPLREIMTEWLSDNLSEPLSFHEARYRKN